ncbi:DUF3726 domain-containing protein [Ruegeria meonggei]|uniref:DUF3726 domain-containing protein n=1 Tax=Ruegeria meonggei TaxID=1446476 RepID=A0A1X6YMG9_9RHOB|nr:DUF3726 domain-containing protein [Ruegeria meonggei]SLN25052.1 hypothetical protein RUM8411_00998 [Ruegeria meonggei]
MSFSLNEVESTSKRAARGAGYSWGHAEEAAKATRWLCAQGLDGVGALAQLLQLDLVKPPEAPAPDMNEDGRISQSMLCPLTAGPAVSDRAQHITGSAVSLSNLAMPILLLPFAANAARLLKSCITVTFDGVDIVTDGFAISNPSTTPDHAKTVSVRVGGTLTGTVQQQTRATPDPADWTTLNRIAHRTYAPATEESRLRGAGAGLSDND